MNREMRRKERAERELKQLKNDITLKVKVPDPGNLFGSASSPKKVQIRIHNLSAFGSYGIFSRNIC